MGFSKGVVILVVVLAFGSCLAEKKQSGSKESCEELMYPVYPQDYQLNIHSSSPQLTKDLDFELPFYGFRYNYTRVSMHGYLEFTDPPEHYTSYPLKFPRNYPKENDPSFIGPFYSKMRIGATPEGSNNELKSGVHFRVESNLQDRTDAIAVETRERVQADIRDSDVLAAKRFEPKHVIIATWLRMSFAGGIDQSLYVTNSFQTVVATDGLATYVMFNYGEINWTTHTEAGGDSSTGEGGVPAFVGFNAGQGTRAFEYHPYSQRSKVRDLNKNGCADGLKGRHIFKVDGKIIPGTCSNDMDYVCHLYMDQN